MENEIVKVKNNSSLSLTLKKHFYRSIIGDSKDLRCIPLQDDYHPARIRSENEWNQEYYIIYNSYILEDKGN